MSENLYYSTSLNRSVREPKKLTLIFLLIVIVISCQLTDITIGPVKFWELLAIVFFPFFIKKIEKKILWFFFAFTVLLVFSVLKGVISPIHYEYFSTLKSKYVISFVRYVELLLCLIVALLPFNLVKRSNVDFRFITNKFLTYNAIFTMLVLFLYAVDFILKTSIVSYGSVHRLRGFYVEGGPYGLYISTLVFLELTIFKRKKHIAIFLIALFLTQSKAGFVAFFIFLFFSFFQNNKLLRGFLNPKNMIRFGLSLCIVAIIGVGATYKIANNYFQDIQNIDEEIKGRENDSSLVMGRIAASDIGPRIFQDNPFFGVGLGAYSLVRNNVNYRGAFPVVNGWDLTGLGGFFNLLVENGVLGVLIFVFAIKKYYKLDFVGGYFLLLFVLPFILGAQLYMVYPWLYLGLYYAFKRQTQ
ncbi:O-antigen ligase family protein [Klebsiella michiganensis]|uniref:O-antigen ligase family protein n=1 Tax=Klebsiella michiganensis TaxID=1134687 RepID=UPI000D64DAEE|nr:O-antigen ligase family protein [Klebsiella michiganensis]